MEKIFEGAISCKALLEAGSRDCKKLYIDKKKNTKDTRYLAKIAKSRGCEVVFCSRDEINELATGKTHGGILLLAEEKQIPIVGEIPRSDEIIRWEDQGKTVIEGDADSEISKRFFELAEKLLEDETERVR